MLIKRVKRTNLFDVFTGNGWNNHTRIAKMGDKLKIISGPRLQKYQMAEFFKTTGVKG